jgi:MFS family permease
VFLASTVAPFNQFKVPPLIPALLAELRLSELQAGLLMSVFSLSGLLTALPAGVLFRRWGPRTIGALAVGSTGVGAVIGAVAPGAELLLVGRFVEGIGMGMTAVFAVMIIVAWFPPGRRGLPLGIFTSWIPLGQMLMLFLAPPIYEAWGWRAVWWVGGASALVLAVLFALIVRLPASADASSESGPTVAFTRVFREPGPWLLALVFVCYHACRVGFSTWTPTYLVNVAGWGLKDAAWVMSFYYLVTLPASAPAGWLIDRFGPKVLILFSMGLAMPAFGVAYLIDPMLMLGLVLWIGALSAVVPTAVNAEAPLSVQDPGLVGPAVGLVAMGRNGGQLIGPLVLAPMIQAGLPWGSVGGALVVLSVVGLLAAALVRTD